MLGYMILYSWYIEAVAYVGAFLSLWVVQSPATLTDKEKEKLLSVSLFYLSFKNENMKNMKKMIARVWYSEHCYRAHESRQLFIYI